MRVYLYLSSIYSISLRPSSLSGADVSFVQPASRLRSTLVQPLSSAWRLIVRPGSISNSRTRTARVSCRDPRRVARLSFILSLTFPYISATPGRRRHPRRHGEPPTSTSVGLGRPDPPQFDSLNQIILHD